MEHRFPNTVLKVGIVAMIEKIADTDPDLVKIIGIGNHQMRNVSDEGVEKIDTEVENIVLVVVAEVLAMKEDTKSTRRIRNIRRKRSVQENLSKRKNKERCKLD